MPNSLPNTLPAFIWHFLKSYKYVTAIYIILAICAGFWEPLNSILIQQIVDLLPFVQKSDMSILLLPASLLIINVIIFDNITWRGCNYIRSTFVPVIINHIIHELMGVLLDKSSQFYQDSLSGKISKQITNLANGIEALLTHIIFNFLRGTLLLTTVITAHIVHPIFCFILSTWFVIFAGISILMSKKLTYLSDIQASTESIVIGEVVDSLSNHSNIRIFSRKSYENRRLAPFLKNQQKAYRATYFYSFIMHSIQGGLIALMIGFSTYYLIYFYGMNLVTIGEFVLILGLSMGTGDTMWSTMLEVDEYNKAMGRCKQSLNALMVPLEVKDKPNAFPLTCEKGKIAFENVFFHYKDAEPLFQNTHVEITPGQKVGLVGYSGGGKSTFVNLILRLYDVTDGRICIDDQDIRDVTQESLRCNIGMIPQDPSLFHRSLMDNIRYGNINATDEDVIGAAKKAHAHEFSSKHPQGYNSLVGERGVKLSGGQRQRIAIARVILKNAPILILDEATSQLDSVTENIIQDSLWGLMQGKTTLVVAHRLSTLLHMDRILVFDQGNIVEDGSHEVLLSRNGIYKTLWNTQIGGFIQNSKHEDK